MSGIMPFKSAWDAAAHLQGASPIRGYARESLSSGMARGAAVGYFRRALGFSGQDLIMVIGSRISLFSLDTAGMKMTHVCSAPVFVHIVGIECLRVTADHDRHMSRRNRNDRNDQSDLCVVLEESGQLAVLSIEHVGDRYRFKTVEQTQVFGELVEQVESLMLHKVVVDPLARMIVAVSWTDRMEMLFAGQNHGIQQGTEHNVLFGTRISIDIEGAICDAAILSPLQSEIRRILLVAAAVERVRNHVILHLYESWTTDYLDKPSVSLVAKLPLPYNMSLPMYIVTLPGHHECFLLINESEIAFVSAQQILSGDVNLYFQPVPRLANEAPDLVRAYCVAGSVEIARTHLFGEGRRSSESAIGGMQTAQNVYIATQSGALHCVRATRKPFISITRVEARHGGGSTGSAVPATAAISQVGPMLYLGSHSSKRHRNTDTTELAPDFLFCGGECADNAIVRVADEGFWSNTALQHDGGSTVAPNSESTLVWSSRRTVSNPSPMADFILEPHQSYWAAGIGSNGVIHQAQFGHGVRFEETVCFGDTEATGSSRAVTHIWSFTVPSISGRDKTLCMVLQVAETYIPIIRDDEEGEWQLLSALQLLLTDKRLLYVGSGGFDSSGDHQVICISNKCVFLVVGATTSFTMSENIKRSIVYEASDSEVFTHGACVESLTNNNPCNGTHSWVVLATRKADASSSIRLVSLSDSNVKLAGGMDVLPGPFEFAFSHEISVLRVVSLGTTQLIVVGTYEPRLLVYRFDPNPATVNLVFDVDISEYIRSTSDESVVDGIKVTTPLSGIVISDACILCSSTSLFVLAGLRDGTMIQYEIDRGLQELLVKERWLIQNSKLTRVGPVQVQFVEASQLESGSDIMVDSMQGDQAQYTISHVLILCERIFVASLLDIGLVNIAPCALFSHNQALSAVVSQIASVPTDWYEGRYGFPSTTVSSHTAYCLVATKDGSVSVATINLDAQCHVRELPIDVEPRRIIRDSETGMMLVAGVSRPIETTFTSVPTSLIKVIDVSSGEVHTEIKLEPQEIIHSLETWHIQGQKSYRYICIGTGQYGEPGIHQRKQIVPSPRAAGGRLVIYSLKALKRKPRTKSDKSGRKQRQQSDTGMSGYELRYVWESRRSAAVKALAHMGDSYLIVGEGTLCTVLQLDVVQRQLIECCEIELRFPVSSIDVRGNDIVVGSSRETVHLLQFVQSTGDDGENIRRLEMLHSARFGVSTADARYLSSDKIVGVDTSGYLYVVGVPGNTREFALDFIMGIHLGTECTNVKIGSLVHCIQKSKHVLPWDFKETVGSDRQMHQPVDAVVISSLAGALWTLCRIDNDAYDVLHALEQAMVSMGSGHPAQPLLSAGKSIRRTCLGADRRLLSDSIIEGTLPTIFFETLTNSEQLEVVNSSSDLQRAVKRLSRNIDSRDSSAAALTTICQLITELNHS